MTKPHRQRYGLGSIIKKAVRGVKKIVKSPLGKAALLGAGAYFAPMMWGQGAGFGGWGKGIGALRNKMFGQAALGTMRGAGPLHGVSGGAKIFKSGQGGGGLFRGALDWMGKHKGQTALLGLGAAGMALPFLGGKEEEEEEESDWSITPPSIANIRNMARNRDPSLAFLPPEASVQPNWYAAEGGIAQLANGGGAANAQAEQMLRMHYQEYRNQGGTMSYQQFKMAVLQQAQAEGPMAQEQAQMSLGGRPGYQGGELIEDASMIEETPTGMMAENVEEVQGEPTREQLEALAMEIFQLRLEELDEEQLMIVYQAAMEQQPEEVAMQEEDIQFDPQMAAPQMAANGGIIGTHVPGYTTPPGYNQFDYPSGGVRVGRAEGGLMSLGGMEKDYRAEGGFVPIGGEERADDVPARLSKNEFVFTADAVRNAGGGNIDAGAEVMQNVMNNLEAGGQISEESQGAQDMYNNMQQLQTRME